MAQGNKQWRDFVDQLKERAGSQPSSPMFRVRLGNALERIGETEAAIAEYRAAAELFLRTGFARHARSVYRMILDRSPNDREARRGYARALKECFDDSENLDEALQVPEMPDGEDGEGAPPQHEDDYWSSVRTQDPGTLFEAEGEDFAMVRPGNNSGGNGAVQPPRPPTPPSNSAPTPPPPPVDASSVPAPPPPEKPDTSEKPAPAAASGDPAAASMPASVLDRRRAPRVPWDVETHVSDGSNVYIGTASDLSATGVFIEGLTSIEPGELVDLTFHNDEDGWKGSGRGQVSRLVEPDSTRGRVGGVGIALLWVDPPTEHWMIRHIEVALGRGELHDGSPLDDDAPEVAPQPGRTAPRVPLVVPARVTSREFEAVGWSLDLSEGGAFLAVPQLFSRGEAVEVTLWLDRTDAPLTLDAQVIESRKATSNRRSGVAVRFSVSDDGARERLDVAVRAAGQTLMVGN